MGNPPGACQEYNQYQDTWTAGRLVGRVCTKLVKLHSVMRQLPGRLSAIPEGERWKSALSMQEIAQANAMVSGLIDDFGELSTQRGVLDFMGSHYMPNLMHQAISIWAAAAKPDDDDLTYLRKLFCIRIFKRLEKRGFAPSHTWASLIQDLAWERRQGGEGETQPTV